MAIDKLTSQALASGSVTSDAIATGAITVADIPNGEITAAKLATTAISDKLGYTPVSPTTLNSSLAFKANTSSLGTLAYVSPTGTGDTTKFLRGDNSWQAPGLSSLSDLSLSSVAGNDIISYAGTTTSTGGTFTTSNWTLAEWGKSNATVTVNDASPTFVTQIQLLTTGSTITVTKTSGGSSTLTLTGAPTLSYGTTYVIPVNTNSGTGSTESLTTIVIPSGSVTTYGWKNSKITANSFSTTLNQQLTTPFVKKQVVHRRPIYGVGTLSAVTGDVYRNDSTTLCTPYGPFAYACPGVQPGAERRFRIYAVYSDGSQNQGEPQLFFRPNDSATNQVVFTLQSTWGGTGGAQRDWYSNEIIGTPWGDHANVRASGTGSVNYAMRFHYIELQALDVFI